MTTKRADAGGEDLPLHERLAGWCEYCNNDPVADTRAGLPPCKGHMHALAAEAKALADRLAAETKARLEAQAMVELLEGEVKAAETRSGMDNAIAQFRSQLEVETKARETAWAYQREHLARAEKAERALDEAREALVKASGWCEQAREAERTSNEWESAKADMTMKRNEQRQRAEKAEARNVELWTEREKAERENERLRETLTEIESDIHQSYEGREPGQYGIGVADGHRCAARKARAALRSGEKP